VDSEGGIAGDEFPVTHQVSRDLLYLARYLFHNPDETHVVDGIETRIVDDILNAAWFVADTHPCGFGGRGYASRDLRTALLLLEPFYPPHIRRAVASALANDLEFGEVFWPLAATPGYNTDYVYTRLRHSIGYAAIMTQSDEEAVAYLSYIKTFLDRFLTPTHTTADGLKFDSLGYHHRAHYLAYMYALRQLIEDLDQLRNTPFMIEPGSYALLRDAVYAMVLMGNETEMANSLSGRHPLSTELPMGSRELATLASLAEGVVGQPDELLTGAANRIWGPGLLAGGEEATPNGFWQFNSGGFALYRWNDWVATMKGFSSAFWGTEIYVTSNRYGRYQSYGSLQIMYPGGRAASGVSTEGWNWNVVPGATTIHLSFEDLRAKFQRQDERTESNFLGAVRFDERQNGLRGLEGEMGFFAMGFEQWPGTSCRSKTQTRWVYPRGARCDLSGGDISDHGVEFTFQKSAFMVDGRIIMLGSSISNSDATNRTATNLFQVHPRTTDEEFVVDGVADATHLNSKFDPSVSHWLLDNAAGSDRGTGYYLPACNEAPCPQLTLRRDLTQEAPGHNGPGRDDGSWGSADYMTAWLDHGTAPSNASYEYVAVPGVTASEMETLAVELDRESEPFYEVHQQDLAAHVIEHVETETFGYALFQTGSETLAGPIASSATPAIAMARRSADDQLLITVINPDLAVDAADPETSVVLTLRGSWSIADGVTEAVVLSHLDSETVIEISTAAGLPQDLTLSRD